MRNKLRAMWHILLGDPVMYRITASRHDRIAFNTLSAHWWRPLFPPANDAAIVECDTWEEREARWQALSTTKGDNDGDN